jgi:RimJ/RimL family protein N-acetyltransferase
LTAAQYDLIMRPLTGPDELDLFCRLPYVLNDEFADDLAAGRRRPGWMWMALRGDRLVARLAWWGQPDKDVPALLDVFDIDDADAGRLDLGVTLLTTAMAAVLDAGHQRPEYIRFVPAGWRDTAAEQRAVEDRMTAMERTGAEVLVERLRLEWRPGAPVPGTSGRLTFRPVTGRAELVALMARVLDGTLDAHSRADLTRMPPERVAAQQYDNEFMGYGSPQDWWRVAVLPSGEPVGFVIPARNDYNAIIAYLGVLPAHRGNGYIDHILAEGTRVLAAQDVPRIRASTDVGNVPMQRAFQRAGYITFERQISMHWPGS